MLYIDITLWFQLYLTECIISVETATQIVGIIMMMSVLLNKRMDNYGNIIFG